MRSLTSLLERRQRVRMRNMKGNREEKGQRRLSKKHSCVSEGDMTWTGGEGKKGKKLKMKHPLAV